jgi:hypothetical protein
MYLMKVEEIWGKGREDKVGKITGPVQGGYPDRVALSREFESVESQSGLYFVNPQQTTPR